MSGKKSKRIVVPTEDEVAQFAGQPARADEPAEQTTSANGTEASEPAETRSEAEVWKEKCLRAKADLANYQRRAEKGRAESLRYAQARLVQALLPVLDDLERVVASGSESAGDADAVLNGVNLTLENLLKVLRDFEVTRIDAVGQPFDPSVHEAMMQRESPDHAEPTVLEEMVKGYQLHDRVLRPARVIVSKAPEPADEAGEDRED